MNRFGVVLAAALGSSLAAPATTSQSQGIDDFGWLVGTWMRTFSRGTVHETWRRLGDSMLEGGSYVIDTTTDTKRQDEWILLANMDGTLYYIAKPKQNPEPTAFKLVAVDADSATFENPNHDFPQRIIYTRQGESAMTVTIEGPGDNGEIRRIDFSFERLE